jgi:hypothetical protein
MKIKTSNNTRTKPTPTITFRGVLPAVDKLLPNLGVTTPEYAIMKFLRDNAVGQEDAKSWKEIQPHLRKSGHGSYTKRIFQVGFLQFCRRNEYFIASSNKGYYLPEKTEDFAPYVTATEARIRGEEANLHVALTLMKRQQEYDAAKKSRRPRTRTTAKRKGEDRPATATTPRKARSKGRSSARS